MLSTDLAVTDQLDRLSSNVAGWGLRARAISPPQFASITSLQKRDRAYLNKHDTTPQPPPLELKVMLPCVQILAALLRL